MKPCHVISSISVTDDTLVMVIDGKNHRFLFAEISNRLSNASRVERERFEVSPSGYGIHWPLLDEDLSIDGLLGITHELPARNAA